MEMFWNVFQPAFSDMPDEFGTEKLKNGHVGRLTPKSSNFDMCNSWAVMVQKRDKYISSIACGLCFDSSDLYINLGCGHVMLCFQCILRLPQSHKTCPICRTSLSAVQKFHSKCVETSVVPPGRNVSEMLNGSVFWWKFQTLTSNETPNVFADCFDVSWK